MDAGALLIGDYLKAVELGNTLPEHPTFRIKAVQIETMASLKNPGREVGKGVVMFDEVPRGWVMNRTNVECLKALFGAETNGWIGKRVTLGQEPTKTGPGIRVHGSPDIDRDVIAEWTPPRQKKVSKRMVPTGDKPAQPRHPANEPAPFTLATWKQALTTAGHDPDKVIAWLGTLGADVTAFVQGEYTAVLADIAPHGARRVEFDAYLAR